MTVTTFGPVILNNVGEMVYTFRPDRTMVKLDYGMTHPAVSHHIAQSRGLYVCPSTTKATDGSNTFVEYLVILNSGAIRLTYAAQPNALRFTVLTKKPIPDEIKKHLFNEKGEQATDGILKATNNPAIGFKLLLDLLDEVDVNGDTVSN